MDGLSTSFSLVMHVILEMYLLLDAVVLWLVVSILIDVGFFYLKFLIRCCSGIFRCCRQSHIGLCLWLKSSAALETQWAEYAVAG